MVAEDVLRSHEAKAVAGGEIVSRVVGRAPKKKRRGALSAAGFITAMIAVVAVLFSSGNLIPAAISERLVEATDVQYADAVESKILVFQQALASGSVPANTVKRLKEQGVMVGFGGSEFIESGSGTALLIGDTVVEAKDFVTAVHANAKLYEAFNAATYGRAAYYYDATAEGVMKQLGTSRNNYSAGASFTEVMEGLLGEGSKVTVDNVVTGENEKGEVEYSGTGSVAVDGSAEEFVRKVAEGAGAESVTAATGDAAEALNIADTMTTEQRSSLFFLAFMENISKMKAGEGNESKINEAMNYLYESRETEVVDVRTGEVVKVKGSMMEAPSLYAVLSGEKVEAEEVSGYAADRILATVGNVSGVAGNREGTVASVGGKTRGTIGKLVGGSESGNYGDLGAVVPTVEQSMVENSFQTIGGVYGGEMLVQGAVNVGKMLARAGGASAGDAAAVRSYARVTETVLALDAEVDRNNRSPFDITSRNTFLGSVVYKLGVIGGKGLFSALVPSGFADEGSSGYLSSFGDCTTLGSVGAVGSVGCAEIATFDTSTLNDTFNDSGFVAFVEENTEIGADGAREVKEGSVLAQYIKYNDGRLTPTGVTDGGILDAVVGGEAASSGSKVPFISDIVSMIRAWLGASEEDKRVATGAAFVNSTENGDWEKYKYAQRYVALARATEALRQYDGEETAYANLRFFEGGVNPVVAFLQR